MSILQAYQRLCKFDEPFIRYWHVAFVIQKRMGYMSNISQHINSKYMRHLWEKLVLRHCSLRSFVSILYSFSLIVRFVISTRIIVYCLYSKWLPAFLKSTKHIACAVFPFNNFEEKYTLDWCKIRSRYDLLISVSYTHLTLPTILRV